MKVFKRYKNRKLYDAEESKYVNLQYISDHIKSGGDITVVDFNGQDITRKILGQVIAEEADSLNNDQLIQMIRSSPKKKEDIFTWEHP